MTETEQRVACALACGNFVHWVGDLPYESKDPKPNWDHRIYQSCPLRRFTEDLNACHEMEETLTPEQWSTYSNKLMVAVRDSDPTLNGSNVEARYKAAHAKAAQRCPAFLKTKGLWK